MTISVPDLYPNIIPYPNWPDDYEHPVCNLCGSSSRWMLIENAKGTRCCLVECMDCGYRFFSPRPTWNALKPYLFAHWDMHGEAQRLYDWCSFTEVPDPAKQRTNIRSYYRSLLAMVEKDFGCVPQSMFEVGGAVGWFMVDAREYGVPLIHGLDLNKYAVEICREKQGFPDVESGDFLEYQPKRRYELVTALDYLEHSYNSRQDLAKFAEMLEPGGIFLAKTFFDEFDHEHEMLAPPVHSVHWTTPVLQRELSKVGLNICTWKEDWKGFFYVFTCRKG